LRDARPNKYLIDDMLEEVQNIKESIGMLKK
jgi:hypothetical protein